MSAARLAPFALLLACVQAPEAPVGEAESAVVYGDDDRRDVWDHPSADWRARAEASIVALVPSRSLDESDPTDVRVLGETLGSRRNLCEGERFRDQPTGANCSGTLIDYDLVLTAGHCVETAAECADTRFVFDYFYEADGRLANIAASDVYGCAELVAQQNGGGVDYAVVRLDRAVDAARAPASVRLEDEPLTVDQPLVVLGFGSGLPLKIDDGGVVLSPNEGDLRWFGANLDTFGGNSGSGVFDAEGNVVGILVRGERDYTRRGDCQIVRVLPDRPGDGSEEECTYVARALEGLCSAGAATALCEGVDATCRACRGPADCPATHACAAGACQPRCEAGACPDGSSCSAEGLCLPPLEPACEGDVVVGLRCGRVSETLEECVPGEVCDAGACVPAAEGDRCATAIAVPTVPRQRLRGTHGARSTNAGEGSCGGESLDTIYTFTLDGPHRLRADASGFDTLLHLRSACDDPASELACDDDGGPRRDARIETELEAGTYFLFMDGWRDSVGSYELDLRLTALMPDAGMPDAGPVDAGAPSDAGSPGDGGPIGPVDAGPIGPSDGGPIGPVDAGVARPDAGAPTRDAGADAGAGADGGADGGVAPIHVRFAWCHASGAGLGGEGGGAASALALGLLAFGLRRRRR